MRIHSQRGARFLSERRQRYENCFKWAGSIRTAGARGTDYSSGRKIQRYKNAESRRIVQQKRDSDKEQRRYLHGYRPALGLAPENGEDVKIYPKTKHATDVLDRA